MSLLQDTVTQQRKTDVFNPSMYATSTQCELCEKHLHGYINTIHTCDNCEITACITCIDIKTCNTCNNEYCINCMEFEIRNQIEFCAGCIQSEKNELYKAINTRNQCMIRFLLYTCDYTHSFLSDLFMRRICEDDDIFVYEAKVHLDNVILQQALILTLAQHVKNTIICKYILQELALDECNSQYVMDCFSELFHEPDTNSDIIEIFELVYNNY